MLSGSKDNVSNLYLAGAGHFSLTDLSLASPVFTRILEGDKSSVESRIYLKNVNNEVLKFLNRYLK